MRSLPGTRFLEDLLCSFLYRFGIRERKAGISRVLFPFVLDDITYEVTKTPAIEADYSHYPHNSHTVSAHHAPSAAPPPPDSSPYPAHGK